MYDFIPISHNNEETTITVSKLSRTPRKANQSRHVRNNTNTQVQMSAMSQEIEERDKLTSSSTSPAKKDGKTHSTATAMKEPYVDFKA